MHTVEHGLPDGSKFATLGDFRQRVISNPAPFVRTFTEKLLIYALARPFEPYDAPSVRQVLRNTSAGGYKFNDLVMGVVKSAPFQMRRVPDPPATVTASR